MVLVAGRRVSVLYKRRSSGCEICRGTGVPYIGFQLRGFFLGKGRASGVHRALIWGQNVKDKRTDDDDQGRVGTAESA
jgi:hypothetical protein